MDNLPTEIIYVEIKKKAPNRKFTRSTEGDNDGQMPAAFAANKRLAQIQGCRKFQSSRPAALSAKAAAGGESRRHEGDHRTDAKFGELRPARTQHTANNEMHRTAASDKKKNEIRIFTNYEHDDDDDE